VLAYHDKFEAAMEWKRGCLYGAVGIKT
jgi:hypothetical protein